MKAQRRLVCEIPGTELCNTTVEPLAVRTHKVTQYEAILPVPIMYLITFCGTTDHADRSEQKCCDVSVLELQLTIIFIANLSVD